MPQLNPNPWFMTLITTWVILLLMVKPALMQLHHSTTPTPKTTSKITPHWTWTWH